MLLAWHPWFEVSAVAASDKNVGKSYSSSLGSRNEGDLPAPVAELQVVEASPQAVNDPDVVFSALPADVAGAIEEEFARLACPVFTNASSHRMDPLVPLLNPEANPDHSGLVEEQRRGRKWDGFIVANPNCTTAISTLSLKPLFDLARLANKNEGIGKEEWVHE